MTPAQKIKAKTKAEAIGIVLKSAVLIKSEQCVHMMIPDDSPGAKRLFRPDHVVSSSI
ncbi:hypothetical protein IVB40_28045 [Bradyrhizobium sp. 40]|jgi:hypothetical protein|uniref:hypothetical protein n=1 Tax=unclassified Bradyrhizobium TaxID=2631580 RepID=UPI001FF731EC|nr:MULTISPECIES: hypothetical protein [unclassified Bradyrhizobium]MCK1397407.1 hypothetical protein [Bradyrhizobium sp. 39]MCK1752554.1 hypothetical protein [Bradyrhizobium sp. 135]UPJ36771.1 hypothetical protein IVB45_08020 [Bradyrhizobium sp. 4]UPJ41107.1 hypothetical protein IVB40_28045 [Bradyrhizobium sp. 40]